MILQSTLALDPGLSLSHTYALTAQTHRVLARHGVHVTLLEKSGQLCSGATWHAAGLVTRFAGSAKLKRIHVRACVGFDCGVHSTLMPRGHHGQHCCFNHPVKHSYLQHHHMIHGQHNTHVSMHTVYRLPCRFNRWTFWKRSTTNTTSTSSYLGRFGWLNAAMLTVSLKHSSMWPWPSCLTGRDLSRK